MQRGKALASRRISASVAIETGTALLGSFERRSPGETFARQILKAISEMPFKAVFSPDPQPVHYLLLTAAFCARLKRNRLSAVAVSNQSREAVWMSRYSVNSSERAEALERIKKLRLEAQLLEYQLTPQGRRLEFWKGVASIAGLVTAAVAAFAFLASLIQMTETFRQSNATRESDLFGRALTQFSEKYPRQRLTGVTYMRSFLSADSPYRIQSAETLASMLGLEADPVVRRSIRDSLIQYVDSRDPHDPSLVGLYTQLVHLSASIAEEQDSLLQVELAPVERRETEFGEKLDNICTEPSNATPCLARAQLKSISDVLLAFIARGVTDHSFAAADCSGCDFRGLSLAGFDFSRAILIGANFGNDNAEDARFDDAILTGTNFGNAHLKGASFKVTWAATNYVERAYESIGGKQRVRGPNFLCADLTDAKFYLHPVFEFDKLTSDHAKLHAPIPPYFSWAELRGADFSHALAYGITDDVGGPLGAPAMHPVRSPDSQYYLEQWFLEPGSGLQNLNSYARPTDNVPNNFPGADWQHAQWPKGIRSLLRVTSISGWPPPPSPPADCYARKLMMQR